MTPAAAVVLFIALIIGVVAWFIHGDKDAD